MTTLTIFVDTNHQDAIWQGNEPEAIAAQLGEVGVRFEQWQTRDDIVAGAESDTVIAAYQREIDKLVDEEGYQTVDVISLDANNPQKDALRQKFLSEHTHSEDEVRFFVQGQGLFALHIGDKVFEVLCEKGDLLSVPANTPHWFDLGPAPDLVAIRFFNNPDGWVAHYTGSAIADHYSRIEA
ncbi:cupin domain-containing protein [Spongiibacter taiwanensis]|uniref:1,2-dihydroxy-3-keto-5-methylthiopentene dioxygenase n=1 Tax=Spongiibacter taiwanensis TaxID=1748242 RepID=UPI0020362854|nr:cupin domain-containing protein [Spongiibacter taiwanensis]USA42740.1 cupin domain-containing protein [Spongiibacter taiwanensis]